MHSTTALATSLMRAVHTRLDDHPLIEDLWGDRLVSESARTSLLHAALSTMDPQTRANALLSPGTVIDGWLRRSPAYANVILRTRFAEDALKTAVARGIRQYVLVGAGFDSFALRRPAFAADLQIFEIDSPATQNFKRARIAECGVSLSSSLHFIAADLSQETLSAALARSAFDPRVLSLFSWLGVTVYLSREANLSTFRSIAACSPLGSEVVFTYMDKRVFAVQPQAFREMQDRVAAVGEPFISGFNPSALAEDLEACGLRLIEDLTGSDAAARYGRLGENSLGRSSFSHIALARVMIG
ncbi:MAG TPA: SAM-dependent methyltransferase [Steroidobacteraceae bacterium]